MKEEKKVNKTKLWVGIFLSVLLLVIILFFSGYRVVNGFKVGKVGQLTMIIPHSETLIFIDESKKIITKEENQTLTISLSPKKHSVIISDEGYYPWKKDFVVESSGEVNLSPIFVSQNPSGNIVTKNDPEYYKIKSEINNNLPPIKEKPKNSKDGSMKLWLKNNTIMVQVGEKVIDVLKPIEDVKNLEFYKDGADAVVFSAGNGVYVVEIDKDGSQNFMPIYKGQNPRFTKDNPDYIYILDSETLMQVIM
ncbi:MAG: hypothetical protein CEO12_64 [Parcubacteria group bacterium Gr01-1014_46]|nr:MAG: hypothetical protein CEO12_64 [Parcubacteria group bacterium Gr01-1014_46]